MYHNGQWGSICSRGFNISLGKLMCKSAGFDDLLYRTGMPDTSVRFYTSIIDAFGNFDQTY